MKTGIVAIVAQWDLPYIEEWIEYHRAIGMDSFLLFLNNWTEQEELKFRQKHCEDGVRIIRLDGTVMQLPAYNQGTSIMYALGVDWVAYIDLDEFIKVRSTRELKDILSDYEQTPQLSLNWRLYGSNGIEKVEEVYDPDPLDITDRYSVLGRFTKCDSMLNIHVKQIINLGLFRDKHLALPTFLSPHSTNATSFGLLGEPVFGPFNDKELGRVRELELAHYFTKSRQEYLDRRKTNIRADTGKPRGSDELESLWRDMDKNEIDESTLEYQEA